MSIFQSGIYYTGFGMAPTAASQILDLLPGGAQSFVSTPTPFGTGFSLQVSGGGTIGRSLGTNLTTLITGVRAYVTSLSAATALLFQFYDATAGAAQVTLRVTNTGSFQFYLGSGTGTPLGSASAGGSILLNTWAYLEMTVTISATVGVVELRLNGNSTPIITATGLNTKSTANTFLNGFVFCGPNANANFTDWYMLDGTGSAPLNAYLGNVQVKSDVPNANSAVGGRNAWTPTNPTNVNFSNVANTPAVSTKFNSDSTPGDYDMFKFPALPAGVATVFAVQEWALVGLDAAGARTVELNCYSGGTDSPSAAFTPPAGSVAYQNQISVVDPNTSTVWTPTNAGNAELGAKVQT